MAGLPLKNLDPYQVPEPVISPNSNKTLNYRINGINYVSEKTKKAFEQALQDGHQVSNVTPTGFAEVNGHKPSTLNTTGTAQEFEPRLPQIQTSPDTDHTHSPLLTSSVAVSPKPVVESKMTNYQQILESLEYVVAQFQQNQGENLQVHDCYLNHQKEYAKTFFQLMQQQHSLLANGKADQFKPAVMDSLERSMLGFHTQQGETLRVHEQYLESQVEYTKNFFQLIQQEYSQLVSGEEVKTPVVLSDLTIAAHGHNSSAPAVSKTWQTESLVTDTVASVSPTAAVSSLVMDTVADITESVSPTAAVSSLVMDTVADITESVNPTAAVNSLVMDTVADITESVSPTAAVSSLVMEIVADITEKAVSPTAIITSKTIVTDQAVTSETKSVVTTVTAPPVIESSNATIDLADLGKNLLSITSEKTGYPIEMLDMDMDMEADLGIDSIKRVEILGTMQEMYPDLPKPNLEEISEKRTIGQIVEYLQSRTFQSVSVATIPAEVKENIVSETVIIETASPIEETVVDVPDFAPILLAITSEKTGYPVEMLDVDMDMEADLGIDSIKRVEILGTMQEMYPDLPKPDVEELGELRTIKQIVDYLQQLAGGEKKKPLSKSPKQLGNLNNNILRRQVKLQTLPQPDFLDFTLPEGHVSLITDDGTLTTSKLAQSLLDQGWKVVVLSFPQSLIPQSSPLPKEVNRVTLLDLSEEHLQQQLNAIATNYGAIAAFIHLNPVFEVSVNGKIPYLEQEKAMIKHVFFIAKHLKKSLNQAARQGRSCFCTVARLDGAFGLECKINFGPISAGLFGLTKTLNWEWQPVFCRAIDLSPHIDAETSVHHITAELHDPNRYLTEVAYGSQGRTTLISTPNI